MNKTWNRICSFVLVCTVPTVPGGSVSCVDTDSNGENTPSPNDVCTATCTSGQTPTVAMATCQSDMTFDATLECPSGTVNDIYVYFYMFISTMCATEWLTEWVRPNISYINDCLLDW